MKRKKRHFRKTPRRKPGISIPILSLTSTDLKRALIFRHGSLGKAAYSLGVSRMGLYKVLSGKVRKSHGVVRSLISSFGILPESLESRLDKKRPGQVKSTRRPKTTSKPVKRIKPHIRKKLRRKT